MNDRNPQETSPEKDKPAQDSSVGKSKTGWNPLDLLLEHFRNSPAQPAGDKAVPLAATDGRLDAPAYPVDGQGVLRVDYNDPNFDVAIAQTNYRKVVISGVPKDLLPSAQIDENGKGFFFTFKNKSHPDSSDGNRHYFPPNMQQVEIAQYQGHSYKPVLVIGDELRIAACQEYMKQQNGSGYGSYKGDTDSLSYAGDMARISPEALQYQERLIRECAKNSPQNPYYHVYLADILAAQAVQPVIQAFGRGEKAWWDNPDTNAKLKEAVSESQLAGEITRKYGHLMKPPANEMPLSPFSLNPYASNPDVYWCGAAYQAASRESKLAALEDDVIMGRIPLEWPARR